VILLLLYRPAGGTVPAELYFQLSRWALALELVACILLLPNLALVWASDPAKTYANPGEEYRFWMGYYKLRAARYTIALVLSFVALAFVLVALTRLG